LTFLMLIPITWITSAIFLAMGALARDFKDGQNFITPVYMLFAFPAVVTMVPGVELSAWTAFVPIINIALLIKGLLQAEVAADLAFLVLVSSAAYAALALILAARVFEREQVLLGGRASLSVLLKADRPRGGVPTPATALVSYAVVLVVLFYGSLLLRDAGMVCTILLTEYGLILLPTVLLVVGLRLSSRQTFALRRASLRGWGAAVLLGLSAWTVAGGILIRLLPPPESLVRAMERVLLFEDTPVPLWTVWLVIAITPALCEELLFRGVILSGLRRLGPVAAVALSALLFGIFHTSLYRLLPTAFLGVAFGYLTWKTGSVLPAILAHALNNGLLVTLIRSETLQRVLGGGEAAALPWSLTLAGSALTLAAILLLQSARTSDVQE
jgi:sodium transport system permease protein